MPDELWCIVTNPVSHEEDIEFAILHLIAKGYICKCIVVRGEYYVVRQFLPDELSNKVLVKTHGRYITKDRGEYFFKQV